MVLFLIVCRVFQFIFSLNCELFLYVHFFSPRGFSVVARGFNVSEGHFSFVCAPESALVNTTWKCSLGSEFQCCARRKLGQQRWRDSNLPHPARAM